MPSAGGRRPTPESRLSRPMARAPARRRRSRAQPPSAAVRPPACHPSRSAQAAVARPASAGKATTISLTPTPPSVACSTPTTAKVLALSFGPERRGPTESYGVPQPSPALGRTAATTPRRQAGKGRARKSPTAGLSARGCLPAAKGRTSALAGGSAEVRRTSPARPSPSRATASTCTARRSRLARGLSKTAPV